MSRHTADRQPWAVWTRALSCIWGSDVLVRDQMVWLEQKIWWSRCAAWSADRSRCQDWNSLYRVSTLDSRNFNTSRANGLFSLAMTSRPEPGTGSSPGIAGANACAICKCSGDKECGGGRIHTIWMGRTEFNRKNKAKAQQLCNHDKMFLGICDLNQKRPDGKKYMVHHHDFACSERETEERCKRRRK